MRTTINVPQALLRELANYRVPRNVELAALLTLPVSIMRVGELTVEAMENALSARGVRVKCGVAGRRLRAGLFAYAGFAIILIDGCDGESEQRFSVAHELGHFVVDYLEPRLRAVSELGESAIEVIDGKRTATNDELVYGVLADVRMRPQVHMMERHGDLYTGIDEIRADRLAFELLAPFGEIREALCQIPRHRRRSSAEDLLVTRYEFPEGAARDYAAIIVPESDSATVRNIFGL